MFARHAVFTSYHHENDQGYKQVFNLRFANKFDVMVNRSVELNEIDPNLPAERIRQIIRDEYLRDPSVTVVLVGTHTWQRKHVDWEISASIRHTEKSPRAGLLGILLPSAQQVQGRSLRTNSFGEVVQYDPGQVPPRLHDNVQAGYARLYTWSEDPGVTADRIHDAYLHKSRVGVLPDNSRTLFARNRSGECWSD